MKKFLLLPIVLYVWGNSYCQLLQQDFQSSIVVASYVNAVPGNTLFTQISSTALTTISALSNRLDFTRAGGGIGNFVRSVGFSSSPTSLMIRFDVSVSGNATANTTQGVLYLGTTTTGVSSFADNTSAPLVGNTYARIGIGWTTVAGQWHVRDLTNTTTGNLQTGTKTVLWVVNKTGGSMNYKAPDGTIENIATNKADVWVGTSREFNDVNVETIGITAIDKTKFIFSGQNGTISIDNMLYDPIPLTPPSTPSTGISETTFIACWSPVSGVTGYRLDVATDASFTSLVAGYNNLYVSGQSTSSSVVSGLVPGTTYYYRVRGASQYSVYEFASGNSGVQSTATFLLPITINNLHAYINNNKTELIWSTPPDGNSSSFDIERSSTGKNFVNIGSIGVNGTAGNNYRFMDDFPLEGKGFYRLRIINKNGNTHYSSIVYVNNRTGLLIDVFPNPARESLTLQYPRAGKNNSIRIINENGILIKLYAVPAYSIQMNLHVNELSAGNYFLIYDNGEQKVTTMFTRK